jgi:hypothetical protein
MAVSEKRCCSCCGGFGPFGHSKTAKDGLKTYCRECCAKKQAAYRVKNPEIWTNWAKSNDLKLRAKDSARYRSDPEAAKARTRSWQLDNPEKFKALWCRNNLTKYGITPEQRDQMLVSQSGACAICSVVLATGRGRTGASIDHDHTTGKIRGILCSLCNVMLGDFKDQPGLLASAQSYLQKGVVTGLPPASRPLEAAKPGTRAGNLWYGYGLTEDTVRVIIDRQGGGCAICLAPLQQGLGRHVDHDHYLGRKSVRGVLCRACNLGVGHARDSVGILKSALEYLNRPSE